MARLFKTGARRSHPDKIAKATPAHEHPAIKKLLADHASGAAPLPDSIDLGGYWPNILDQNQTGSCTAHAIACALYTSLAAAGTPLGFVPSPWNTYRATRAKERAVATMVGQALAALTDSGAEIADVMATIAEYGVKPMKVPSPQGFNSDIDSSNVNDEPAVQDLEEAGESLIVGPYAVDQGAENVFDVWAASLANKNAIDIAFECDDPFQA